jgi:hypothetical protein
MPRAFDMELEQCWRERFREFKRSAVCQSANTAALMRVTVRPIALQVGGGGAANWWRLGAVGALPE